MSLILDLLSELNNIELNYKGYRVNIYGLPSMKYYKNSSVKGTVNRLRNDGHIEKKNSLWTLTDTGRKKLHKGKIGLKKFNSPFNDKSIKNLLVLFDVPEEKKMEREWLRSHLKKFNYEMIQKSVWLGPSPLPKEFIDYLKCIKLDKTIKTFKLSKVAVGTNLKK